MLLTLILAFMPLVRADADPETNISSTNRYAWNDATGWWDFHETHTVKVNTSTVMGYASSSVGFVSLNCVSTPLGDICGTSNYKVTNPNAEGEFEGCAWNDTIGWISFSCRDYDCQGGNICAVSNYGVSVNATDGTLEGYAWNDVAGWASFNCANHSGCGVSDYKVETSWRPSSIIGFLESSIIDTQVAVSNCVNGASDPPTCATGTWAYLGPGGNPATYYAAQCPIAGISDPGIGPNKPICIDRTQVANYRYLRYLVRLQSNVAQSITPRVDDVILNWSE